MNQLLKLNVMHKVIMAEIAGEAVIQTGVLRVGWKRDVSVQHTCRLLKNQMAGFKRQIFAVYKNLSDKNSKYFSSSLKMFEKDKRMLEFYVKYDKIHKELFKLVIEYIQFLDEFIIK